MIEKTKSYIAAKQWPANIRDDGRSSKIRETLHETDVADYNYQYTAEQKNAFHSFIEAKDALGMYLFSKRVDIEVYIAIYKGMIAKIERGGKGKRRDEHGEFMKVGEDTFFEIIKMIDSEDIHGVLENIEDC